MRETDPGLQPDAAPAATGTTAVEPSPALEALRLQGAALHDPVGLHYLEQLAGRALTQPAAVQRILLARLQPAMAALQASLQQAREQAGQTLAGVAADPPATRAALQALFDACDYKGLQRLAALPPAGAATTALGALARSAGAATAGPAPAAFNADHATRVELKSVRKFRNTWSKLSADQQLARALDQAPKNAGPINSHAVVLRSLAMMRDISPDYLNRFISYVDTLLCLDQDAPTPAKAAAEGEAGKKPRARRNAAR